MWKTGFEPVNLLSVTVVSHSCVPTFQNHYHSPVTWALLAGVTSTSELHWKAGWNVQRNEWHGMFQPLHVSLYCPLPISGGNNVWWDDFEKAYNLYCIPNESHISKRNQSGKDETYILWRLTWKSKFTCSERVERCGRGGPQHSPVLNGSSYRGWHTLWFGHSSKCVF